MTESKDAPFTPCISCGFPECVGKGKCVQGYKAEPLAKDMAGNAYVQSRATTSPYDLAGQKEYPGE